MPKLLHVRTQPTLMMIVLHYYIPCTLYRKVIHGYMRTMCIRPFALYEPLKISPLLVLHIYNPHTSINPLYSIYISLLSFTLHYNTPYTLYRKVIHGYMRTMFFSP